MSFHKQVMEGKNEFLYDSNLALSAIKSELFLRLNLEVEEICAGFSTRR